MAPTSWLTVVFFLLFIAPGIAYDLLSQRRAAGHAESTFREISRVVLASIGYSLAASGLLLLASLIDNDWLVDFDALMEDGDRYVADHYEKIAVHLLVVTSIAILLVITTHVWLSKKHGSRIRQMSSWTRVFKTDCPPKCYPVARVRLDDGYVYRGRVANFSADLDPSSRELVLAPPISSRGPASTQLERLPTEYGRIVIRGASIVTIAVRYERR